MKKCIIWALALGPALVQKAVGGAVTAPGLFENKASEQRGHIVILAEGLHDRYVDTHLDWVRDLHKRSLKKRDGKDHGQGIQHTYRAKSIGFHGYAGSFSDDVLEEIKRHNHVLSVEEDGFITAEYNKGEDA
ncbi:hypothetical protein H634G_08387 [Metarhizium anisopliae BRIP 53293]|uniref:Inhibitor I9 domain-containing protein n=1 Tax=Metarhizium anisopliae BRIP 53293 TaxID=1291518 RepID=A0A0D9NQJ8_METAN|nr:hypothetical protein H634G_08387 [Metarhizium anisopliae BRIP 53293]KJK94096.1 hypothetical protein H633G_02030 [Metarhizium anisopliae BRIP 53284]